MATLIGRNEELAILRDALNSSGLVLVSGDAGVGKSRLIKEAIESVTTDRNVIWGRTEQVTIPGPFALIVDALQYVVDAFPNSDASKESSAILERITAPRPEEVPLRRISAQVRGVLSLLEPQPVGIFEDLHLCDEASLAVIAHLARSAVEDDHTLIGVFRTEIGLSDDRLERFLESVLRERLALEIRIDPLSADLSMKLASSILPGDATKEAARIASLGEGNPFFIEELASTYDAQRVSLPLSVKRILTTRKQALGSIATQVATVAALMWGSIDVDVLAVACELDRSTVIRAINECVAARLLEKRDERVVFRHALIREGIREDVLEPELEDLNRRIAEGIETIYEADPLPHAFALAQHWYWARGRDRALDWALKAGARALEYASAPEAQSAFELAVACSEGIAPPEALLGLAEVQIREGDSNKAEDLINRAVHLLKRANRLDQAASALGRMAWIRTVSQSGDPRECIDEALSLASQAKATKQYSKLLAQKGQIFVHQLGAVQEGQRLLTTAIELAEREKDLVVQAECADTLAWAAEYERQIHAADKNAALATELALGSGQAETIGRTLNNRALLLALHGRPAEGLALLELARAKLRNAFGASGLSVIDMTEAIARWRMGEPAVVGELVASREVVWPHWRAYSQMLDVWAAIHAREEQRAQSLISRRWYDLRIDPSGDIPIDARTFEAIIAQLMFAAEIGRHDFTQVAKAMLRGMPQRSADDRLLGMAAALRVLVVADELPEAREFLDQMSSELSEYQTPYFAAIAEELRGRIALSERTERGLALSMDCFTGAIELFRSCDNSIDRARVIRLLAAILVESDIDTARKRAREAYDITVSVRSSLEMAHAEALLRHLGVRPRAGRPRKTPEETRSLSAREREVAALVASGATNAEIGARLFLSERTIQDHITHALRKLQATGRAGLAAWAAKNGLV